MEACVHRVSSYGTNQQIKSNVERQCCVLNSLEPNHHFDTVHWYPEPHSLTNLLLGQRFYLQDDNHIALITLPSVESNLSVWGLILSDVVHIFTQWDSIRQVSTVIQEGHYWQFCGQFTEPCSEEEHTRIKVKVCKQDFAVVTKARREETVCIVYFPRVW